jgi:hypothetical protein
MCNFIITRQYINSPIEIIDTFTNEYDTETKYIECKINYDAEIKVYQEIDVTVKDKSLKKLIIE